MNNSEKAVMFSENHQMRDMVKRESKLFPILIVNRRSLMKVKGYIELDELHYPDSHGMDIKMSDEIKIFSAASEYEPVITASEYEPVITQATRSLIEATGSIMGANVENNMLCVSVHYRNVDENDWDLVENRVKNTMQFFPDLILTCGHMVIELRPPIKWNKGNTVKYLLQHILQKLQLDISQILLIYTGDDLTDDDGFEEPKSTKAFYSLKDPYKVMTFIGNLVRWRRITPEVLSLSSACEDDDEVVGTSSKNQGLENESIQITEWVFGVQSEDHTVDKVILPSAIASFPEIIMST